MIFWKCRLLSNTLYRSLVFLLCLLGVLLVDAVAGAAARIKDVVDFQGIRDNALVGYGLVVGLNGTGDGLVDGHFTKQSLEAMLNRLGVKPTQDGLDSKNIAAAMVTANLPPFSSQGSRIDVTVSALGDAGSLQGGTLLVTPLLGADGEVYAVAQGQVAIGGFSAGGEAEIVTKGVPTSGRIANGAIIEREIGFSLADLESIRLSLRNPDLTTARRIAEVINAFLKETKARSLDTGTVIVDVPESYQDNVVGLMTDIEQLRVEPDQVARVVIDEHSGIIVMGSDVRISKVAVAHGNLTIKITETQQVSQPEPFSNTGETTTVDRTEITVTEDEERQLGVVEGGVTLQELVNALNSLGIGPRDLISILQAIKAAGALQAKIEVM